MVITVRVPFELNFLTSEVSNHSYLSSQNVHRLHLRSFRVARLFTKVKLYTANLCKAPKTCKSTLLMIEVYRSE